MQDIESEIFQNSKCNFKQLLIYGFKKKDSNYLYTTSIMDGAFRVEILVNELGILQGKVIDTDCDEEYINFRVTNVGAYVNTVRTAYEKLLNDIKEHCFRKLYYKQEQTNEIVDYIFSKYADTPSFEWIKHPSNSVFRNTNNRQPYAYIISTTSSEVESLYIRLPETRIIELLKQKGCSSSEFLNDKKWIVLSLNNELDISHIKSYLDEAYLYVNQKSEWLVPANPKYYDIIGEFQKTDTTIWKQTGKMSVGDIVYLYLAAPISSILFKCEVIETDIPFLYADDNVKMNKVFRMRKLHTYKEGELSLNLLKKHGITWIRGQRRLPSSLIDEIQQIE